MTEHDEIVEVDVLDELDDDMRTCIEVEVDEQVEFDVIDECEQVGQIVDEIDEYDYIDIDDDEGEDEEQVEFESDVIDDETDEYLEVDDVMQLIIEVEVDEDQQNLVFDLLLYMYHDDVDVND